MIFILSSFCVVIFNFIVAEKTDFSKTTEWTFLSFQMAFLSFKNKTHFRFFRETQDVSTVFPRDTGSKFRETQDIIELLYKDKYL